MTQDSESREMRIRKVPLDIHSSIVVHQKRMTKITRRSVSLDEAAIDLFKQAIKAIPELS